jgi:hypothetical protein
MKGISPDVIGITANKLYPNLPSVTYDGSLFHSSNERIHPSVVKLYEDLYDGKEIEFDLCCGTAPCYKLNSNFSIETKPEFKRRIKCL